MSFVKSKLCLPGWGTAVAVRCMLSGIFMLNSLDSRVKRYTVVECHASLALYTGLGKLGWWLK